MKKILSVLFSTLILIASLSTCLSAYAEEDKSDKVDAQINGAADYILELNTEFTVKNAKDLVLLLDSYRDMSEFEDGFLNSVKDVLDVNDGKLVTTSEDWYQDDDGNWQSTTTSVESPVVYGAVILALDGLGIDYYDFEGYDLAEPFSQLDISSSSDNPYEYYLAVKAAMLIGDEELAAALCDDLISKYYVEGKGMDYYGFSCDNTAMFVYTLADFYEDYKEIMDDAIAVLDSYKTDKGYYGSDDFTPDANCDSTALALAAFSALEDKERADEAYDFLCTFELEDNAGIFDYLSNTEANAFATRDALFALNEYQWLVMPELPDDEEMIPTGVELGEGEDVSMEISAAIDKPATITAPPAKDDDKKTSPDTGNHSQDFICIAGALALIGACTLKSRKK